MQKRKYQEGIKPIIHSTDIYNFMVCPKMSQLARSIEIEPNDAMKGGLILERLVLGDHDKKLDSLLKGKREATLKSYDEEVAIVKPYLHDVKSFVRIDIEKETHILTGEIDALDEFTLFDLKRVKNFDYWNRKTTILDFWQAFYYPYIYLAHTGESKKFQYVIYSTELQLVKLYTIEHPEKRFEEVERMINLYVDDIFYSSDTTKCQQQYGMCNYLSYCDEGKKEYTKEEIINEELL